MVKVSIRKKLLDIFMQCATYAANLTYIFMQCANYAENLSLVRQSILRIFQMLSFWYIPSCIDNVHYVKVVYWNKLSFYFYRLCGSAPLVCQLLREKKD